jgi:hypothetical protein
MSKNYKDRLKQKTQTDTTTQSRQKRHADFANTNYIIKKEQIYNVKILFFSCIFFLFFCLFFVLKLY